MALIKCPECGADIESILKCCPKCGYPINKRDLKTADRTDVPQTDGLKRLKKCLIFGAIICFIVSGVFFYKGYNVKNKYYNSENFPSLSENAYVGGDAYNYIINGTYFTGYSVIASSALLSGMVLISSSVKITIKEHE